MKLVLLVDEDVNNTWLPTDTEDKEVIRVTFDLYRCPVVNITDAGTDGGFATGTTAPSEGEVVISDGSGSTETVSGLKHTSVGLENKTASAEIKVKSNNTDPYKESQLLSVDYSDFKSLHIDYAIYSDNNEDYNMAGSTMIVNRDSTFSYIDMSTDIGRNWPAPWDDFKTTPRVFVENNNTDTGIEIGLIVGEKDGSVILTPNTYTAIISVRLLSD